MTSHNVEALAEQFRDWQKLEDETIRLAEEQQKKTSNSFVNVIMEIIKRDSEKHKIMQQFIIDTLTKQPVTLAPQDLIPLADVLERHIQAEAKSMGLANTCATESKDFFVDFITSSLVNDEVKHHEMLRTLDHVKGAVYPYGVVRSAA
jgi:lipopolysaccharide biosynthesis regulator YciM